MRTGNILDSTSTAQYDFESLGLGEYTVHGFSHLGAIDSSTFLRCARLRPRRRFLRPSLRRSARRVHSRVRPERAVHDLFFSEYVDGTTFSKGLEIYNPSGSTAADLSEYSVKTYNNGSTVPTHEVDLSGRARPRRGVHHRQPLRRPAVDPACRPARRRDAVQRQRRHHARAQRGRSGCPRRSGGQPGRRLAGQRHDDAAPHARPQCGCDVGSPIGTSCRSNGRITRKTPSASSGSTRPCLAGWTRAPCRPSGSASPTSWPSKAMCF